MASSVNVDTGVQIFVGASIVGALAALAVVALTKMPENCRVQKRIVGRVLADPRTDQIVESLDGGAPGVNKVSASPLGGHSRAVNVYRNSNNVNMTMAPMISAFPK